MADQSEKYAGGGQLAGTGTGTTISRHETRYNPWVLTCERWAQIAQYIVLPINPSDISWHIPLKVATEQTGRATVSYVWRNGYIGVSSDGGAASQDSLLQDFELALTFNSGNIAPMFNYAKSQGRYRGGAVTNTDNNWRPNPASKADELVAFNEYSAMGNDVLAQQVELPDESKYVLAYDETIPLGVQNLYKVLSLLDEPRITHVPGSNRNAIRPNRICLVMNTPAFPNMVVYGHANPSGVSWEESADSPNSFDVTFTITVTETQPKLGFAGLKSMLSTYKTGIGATGVANDTRDQIYATQQDGQVKDIYQEDDKGNRIGGSAPSASPVKEGDYVGTTLVDSMQDINDAVVALAREQGDKRTDDAILGEVSQSSLANATMSKEQRDRMRETNKQDAFDSMVDAASKLDSIRAMAAKSTDKQVRQAFNEVSQKLNVSKEDRYYYSGVFDKDSGYSKTERLAAVNILRDKYIAKRAASASAGKIPGASRRGSQSS